MKRILTTVLFLCLTPAVRPAALAAQGPGDPQPHEVTLNARDGSELVRVPAGVFFMGSPEDQGEDNEHPRHEVYLDAFLIAKHEVTVGQLKRFCRETGRELPDQLDHADAAPAIHVTFLDAAAYCAWAGLRLPTEAEWEKAARGGTTTVYSWGDIASHERANFAAAGGRDVWDEVSPVGSFPPNAFGLHDMAGNVWEWCSDRFAAGYYAASPAANPRGAATGEARVLRGGSWDSPADFLRCARRGWDEPLYSSPLLGFRCARDP